MLRRVKPEILDSLSPDDPEAQRSRCDLRMINRWMGGEKWIVRELRTMNARKKVRRLVELGAGEGHLAGALARALPDCEVVAIDLQKGEGAGVDWWQGDVMDYQRYDAETVVVVNLFLHHLEADALARLGEKLCRVRALLASEPHRARAGKFFGRLIFPWINRVTRHDMIVSIEAGFVIGELPEFLKMAGFSWQENVATFGGLRVSGERKGGGL